MNARLERALGWLREGFAQVVRRHPVELLLLAVGCAGCFALYECDDESRLIWLPLAPLFAVVAYVVNNLAGRGPWRKIYWVCWAGLVPLAFWPGFGEWMTTLSAGMTFGVLAPLAVLLCRRAICNNRFVCDGIVWLRSGVLALAFANVALGLFCAILYSTTYIFALEGAWIERVTVYAVILTETLAVPVLLLMLSDRWLGAECRGSKLLDVLLNWIVTPALLIYTAILYLYMIRILVVWELPRGGVAYLVFGFTLLAIGVGALQQLLSKRLYDWFFNRFSLLSLPVQTLFWVGVVRRTNEYGLTEPRVLLLLCGGLMTLCVLLFLSRRTGRYFYVCLAGFAAFSSAAYIPALSPQRIAVRSQLHRAERAARELEWLDGEGRLRVAAVAADDSLRAEKCRTLYEALSYIEGRDTAAFARFGLAEADDLFVALPSSWERYCRRGYFSKPADSSDDFMLVLPDGFSLANSAAYTRIWLNPGSEEYSFDNDTLRLFPGCDESRWQIAGAELLRRQVERAGVSPAPMLDDEQLAKLLVYENDSCRIVFQNMYFEQTDSLPRIKRLDINVLMTR